MNIKNLKYCRSSLENNNSEFIKENNLRRENDNNISQNNITIPFEKKKYYLEFKIEKTNVSNIKVEL